MKKEKLIIGLAQVNTTVGDFSGNLKKMSEAMHLAETRGVHLVVFPELALTGYPPKDLLFFPDFIRGASQALDDLVAFSRNYKLCTLVGTVMENPLKVGRRLTNSALVISGGKIVFQYDKMLLPNYDVFDEMRYFEAGKKPGIFEHLGNQIAITICEDLWNDPDMMVHPLYSPENLQWMEGKRFDVIVNCSASPFALGKKSFKEALLKKQALKNAAPLVHVNLVGGNDDLVFGGESFAVNSQGQLLARAKSFAEDFVYCDLGDHENFISEQNESELESVFFAIVLGTRDFVQKSGHSKIVLGLSGGIDSALVAVIGAHALGSKNVFGLLMPSEYSSPGSIDDALALAKNLSIATRIIPIDNVFHSYCCEFQKLFTRNREGLTFENIQARIRGNLIMAYANEHSYMPIATGNRSELATGYCTLYGDMCGGLAPIGDVPKMMVYALAQLINQQQIIIPQAIIDKAPSAELAPHQVDRDSLPSYDILDAVLAGFLQEKKSAESIAQEIGNSETAEFVVKKILQSEFKRKQAPYVLKINPTSFGTGWRMPVVHGFGLKRSQ